jgi:hypothetical protein
MFVGGLELVNATGSAHHRGGVLSALYLAGYLSMAAVATAWGLVLAVKLGAAVIIVLSIATFVRALATRADGALHSVPLSLPRSLQ